MNKHFILTLCASALLAACSSSSSGGDNNQAKQTPNQQEQSLHNQTSDSNKQKQLPNAQEQNSKSEQQQNSGNQDAITKEQGQGQGQEQVPNNSAQQTPNNSMQNNGNPSTPSLQGQQNNVGQQNPNNPGINPPRSNQPPKYTGKRINKLGSASWEAEKDKIEVYEIGVTQDYKNNIGGARQFEVTKITTLTLADALINPIEGKDYGFWALGDVGYYGFRRNIEANGSNKFNEYIYAMKENLYATDVPTGLSARYQRNGGFVYGPALSQSDALNSVPRQGNVDIIFNNGQATGTVTNENGAKVIGIEGNTKNLIFTTTNQVENLGANKRAAMTPQFINSSENSRDHRYITGIAEGETWVGVLAAEKQ